MIGAQNKQITGNSSLYINAQMYGWDLFMAPMHMTYQNSDGPGWLVFVIGALTLLTGGLAGIAWVAIAGFSTALIGAILLGGDNFFAPSTTKGLFNIIDGSKDRARKLTINFQAFEPESPLGSSVNPDSIYGGAAGREGPVWKAVGFIPVMDSQKSIKHWTQSGDTGGWGPIKTLSSDPTDTGISVSVTPGSGNNSDTISLFARENSYDGYKRILSFKVKWYFGHIGTYRRIIGIWVRPKKVVPGSYIYPLKERDRATGSDLGYKWYSFQHSKMYSDYIKDALVIGEDHYISNIPADKRTLEILYSKPNSAVIDLFIALGMMKEYKANGNSWPGKFRTYNALNRDNDTNGTYPIFWGGEFKSDALFVPVDTNSDGKWDSARGYKWYQIVEMWWEYFETNGWPDENDVNRPQYLKIIQGIIADMPTLTSERKKATIQDEYNPDNPLMVYMGTQRPMFPTGDESDQFCGYYYNNYHDIRGNDELGIIYPPSSDSDLGWTVARPPAAFRQVVEETKDSNGNLIRKSKDDIEVSTVNGNLLRQYDYLFYDTFSDIFNTTAPHTSTGIAISATTTHDANPPDGSGHQPAGHENDEQNGAEWATYDPPIDSASFNTIESEDIGKRSDNGYEIFNTNVFIYSDQLNYSPEDVRLLFQNGLDFVADVPPGSNDWNLVDQTGNNDILIWADTIKKMQRTSGIITVNNNGTVFYNSYNTNDQIRPIWFNGTRFGGQQSANDLLSWGGFGSYDDGNWCRVEFSRNFNIPTINTIPIMTGPDNNRVNQQEYIALQNKNQLYITPAYSPESKESIGHMGEQYIPEWGDYQFHYKLYIRRIKLILDISQYKDAIHYLPISNANQYNAEQLRLLSKYNFSDLTYTGTDSAGNSDRKIIRSYFSLKGNNYFPYLKLYSGSVYDLADRRGKITSELSGDKSAGVILGLTQDMVSPKVENLDLPYAIYPFHEALWYIEFPQFINTEMFILEWSGLYLEAGPVFDYDESQRVLLNKYGSLGDLYYRINEIHGDTSTQSDILNQYMTNMAVAIEFNPSNIVYMEDTPGDPTTGYFKLDANVNIPSNPKMFPDTPGSPESFIFTVTNFIRQNVSVPNRQRRPNSYLPTSATDSISSQLTWSKVTKNLSGHEFTFIDNEFSQYANTSSAWSENYYLGGYYIWDIPDIENGFQPGLSTKLREDIQTDEINNYISAYNITNPNQTSMNLTNYEVRADSDSVIGKYHAYAISAYHSKCKDIFWTDGGLLNSLIDSSSRLFVPFNSRFIHPALDNNDIQTSPYVLSPRIIDIGKLTSKRVWIEILATPLIEDTPVSDPDTLDDEFKGFVTGAEFKVYWQDSNTLDISNVGLADYGYDPVTDQYGEWKPLYDEYGRHITVKYEDPEFADFRSSGVLSDKQIYWEGNIWKRNPSGDESNSNLFSSANGEEGIRLTLTLIDSTNRFVAFYETKSTETPVVADGMYTDNQDHQYRFNFKVPLKPIINFRVVTNTFAVGNNLFMLSGIQGRIFNNQIPGELYEFTTDEWGRINPSGAVPIVNLHNTTSAFGGYWGNALNPEDPGPPNDQPIQPDKGIMVDRQGLYSVQLFENSTPSSTFRYIYSASDLSYLSDNVTEVRDKGYIITTRAGYISESPTIQSYNTNSDYYLKMGEDVAYISNIKFIVRDYEGQHNDYPLGPGHFAPTGEIAVIYDQPDGVKVPTGVIWNPLNEVSPPAIDALQVEPFKKIYLTLINVPNISMPINNITTSQAYSALDQHEGYFEWSVMGNLWETFTTPFRGESIAYNIDDVRSDINQNEYIIEGRVPKDKTWHLVDPIPIDHTPRMAGTIVYSDDDKPVEDVYLYIDNVSYPLVNGKFEITDISPTNHTLSIRNSSGESLILRNNNWYEYQPKVVNFGTYFNREYRKSGTNEKYGWGWIDAWQEFQLRLDIVPTIRGKAYRYTSSTSDDIEPLSGAYIEICEEAATSTTNQWTNIGSPNIVTTDANGFYEVLLTQTDWFDKTALDKTWQIRAVSEPNHFPPEAGVGVTTFTISSTDVTYIQLGRGIDI